MRTARDPQGITSLMTALHYAAEGGHVAAMEMLLKYGASPHAENEGGSTVFLRAARSGSLRAMKVLRDAGCDIDTMAKGHTPLYEAVTQGRPRVACQLLYWGADLEIEAISTRYGQSALTVIAIDA
ncbi:ankyrin [Thozetella sp. PMI_491]|nr:ankyrin [Thozetella sp. PMI_491]